MPRRADRQKLMRTLFMTLGVLVVMLIVVLIFIVTGVGSVEQQIAIAVEAGRFVQGVSVAGVDVSGLKFDEAADLSEIRQRAKKAEQEFRYTFTVQDKEFTYTAEELSLSADIDATLTNAMKWGNVGDSKDKEKEQAAKSGKNFDFVFKADANKIAAFLKKHKSEYDTLPKNATIKLSDNPGSGSPIEFVSEENGIDVNVPKLAGMIAANIAKQDYGKIEAPVLIFPPAMDVKTLKENISLEPIATFTSKFNTKHLSAPNRVNNIKIMGNFVNGCVIEPGEEWSMNETAGPRNAQTANTVGWTMAPGLQDGTTTDQYGGGVCQISSTTYNAAIRAELTVVERYPHSWKSDYIEEGMDATVTTGLKDLRLRNPYHYPVLLNCIVDEKEKTATVNIYGPPMKYTVKFTTKLIKNVAPGAPIYYYNQKQTPDGTPIPPNTSVTWVSAKNNRVVEVYIHRYDKDGNEIGNGELFTTTTYRAYPAEIYCNYPPSGPVETQSAS